MLGLHQHLEGLAHGGLHLLDVAVISHPISATWKEKPRIMLLT